MLVLPSRNLEGLQLLKLTPALQRARVYGFTASKTTQLFMFLHILRFLERPHQNPHHNHFSWQQEYIRNTCNTQQRNHHNSSDVDICLKDLQTLYCSESDIYVDKYVSNFCLFVHTQVIYALYSHIKTSLWNQNIMSIIAISLSVEPYAIHQL